MKSMRAILVCTSAALVAAAAALPAFAAEMPHTALAQAQSVAPQVLVGESTVDVKVVVTWMIACVLLSGLVLAALYMFKRRIGGFPAHPKWVAPISIMKASDLPGDVDPHESTPPDIGAHATGH
ncbi:MAG: hypothetical protein ABI305_13135, partial [Tepidiformaceae bacterium]